MSRTILDLPRLTGPFETLLLLKLLDPKRFRGACAVLQWAVAEEWRQRSAQDRRDVIARFDHSKTELR